MFVLGLTGSLAMGKSVTARMFRRRGVPVSDADAIVHALLGPRGGAVAAVAEYFPETRNADAIDRARLGRIVFGDREKMRLLESILHPLVRREHLRFLARCRRRGVKLAVLDIPLLFETGWQRHCGAVAVVAAPAFIQRRRALSRPGMDEASFARILCLQMPDREKRRRADFILHTGLGKAYAMRQVTRLVRRLRY